MGELEYEEALKLGRKEYKACVSSGRFPYLPAGKQIVLTTSGWTVVETREIPYYDMLLGTKENIMTPSGKKIAVTVPECCIEGKQLR